MLSGLFASCQAIGQAVRPSRFSLVILGVGVAAFFGADQTPEALITLCHRDDPWAVLAFLLAVVAWGHTSWYFARVLSRFEYPDRAALSPRAQRLESAIVEWLPRALGVAPVIVVALEMSLCARRTRAVIPAAIGLWLSALVWGVFLTKRRDLLGWLRERSGRLGERRAVASLWKELDGFASPSKRGFYDLPAITRVALGAHLVIFVGLLVLADARPLGIPRWLGAQTILVLAMASWIIVGSWITHVASWLRMPLFLFIAAAAVVVSPLTDDHVASRRATPDARLEARPTLQGDFATWRAGRDGPFVVVATEGGGIRAAYWTAAMLAALQDTDPTFASRIYAISSVSGGSVGAAVFDALAAAPPANFRNTAGDILSDDALAPALARMLYPDLVQRLLPVVLPGADRGAALEESWVASVKARAPASSFLLRRLDERFWVDEHLPRLFLNTTWVETGKRVVLAYPNVGPACVDTEDGDRLADFSVADAVLTSARFAYVSPAVTVPGTGGGGAWGHLVDGGYFENSGALTAAELLAGIGDLDDARVILLRYDDGKPVRPSVWATELTSPPDALMNARGAREALAVKTLERMLPEGHVMDFVLRPVATPLPLGWMLSAAARTDINARVDEALKVNQSPPSPGRQVLGWWAPSGPPSL